MGQINLYKIDNEQKSAFYEKLNDKFQCIGSDSYSEISEDSPPYEVGIYINNPSEQGKLSWQWLLNIYDYTKITTNPSPKAIILIQDTANMYAVTFGMSYFIVDKFCDVNFAFDFVRRIKLKQIKTTTLTSPNAKRNKLINVYIDYTDFDFDSGESFAKIKAKADISDDFTIHGEMIEIGHSIKTSISNDNIIDILVFLEYVLFIQSQAEIYKFPIFMKVKDSSLISELENKLKQQLDANIDCINISELDIIGATEIFNNNDSSFTLKYSHYTSETYDELSKENILHFITENNINIGENLLDIKIISNKNNIPVDTNIIKKMIDYIDDEYRCLLLKGAWYFFNDDYINYLQDSISEIPIIYNSQYDFSSQLLADYQERKYNIEKILPEYIGLKTAEIKKKINDKYYAERVFNLVMEELYGFTNYDRIESRLGNEKIELMDLYQNDTMFAVKIGNSSSKLSYAVEQSISSVKAYSVSQQIIIPTYCNFTAD